MKAADASAGVIKSGGKTRRAAKMVVLNADHPDIVDFIKCKVEEERKAWALIEAGYDSSLDGPAYGSVFFQNANNSRARHRRLHAGGARRRRLADALRQVERSCRDSSRAQGAPHDCRGRARMRRPRHAIRHHHQPLAHLPRQRAHQRVESVQRVHASRQLGVQSRVAQPDEVHRRARRVRRARVPPRGRRADHGAGYRRR